MRKLIGLLLAVLFAGALAACEQQPTTPAMEAKASHDGGPKGTIARHTWGNDHLWMFTAPTTVMGEVTNPAGITVFGSPSNEASHRPFYMIGPDAGDDGVQTTAHGSGPHDHVLPVPPKNKGDFSAMWHFKVVLPAPGGDVASSGALPVGPNTTIPMAHAADTDGDGDLEQLTSAQKVEDAAALGNVTIAPTPVVFVCPVRDIEG